MAHGGRSRLRSHLAVRPSHRARQRSDPPIFDGWTILGAVAENTKRTRIGLNVTGNPYRHPGLLAKIAVTVDHLSGGRLEMGMGAAWNEPEFKMYGIPFPSAADRIRMMDEACSVLKALWTEERATFKGRFYQLDQGDRGAEADPEAVSADLDRRGRAEAHAARRREARRRVELECSDTCGHRRAHEDP